MELEKEISSGISRIKNGYVYPNEKPGLGIEFNESLAQKYPCENKTPDWTVARLPDSTIWRP